MSSNSSILRVFESRNMVWDVGLMDWVAETQPGGSGGGGAVTIADGADVTQGAKADAAWVSGDGTVISLLKTIASGTSGAVTVNNAAGASAVNIQDGGNSITVDGTVDISGTVTTAGLSLTTSGSMAVGGYLELDTTGMATMIGHAITNDTASTYQVVGTIDGTNFYYACQPYYTPSTNKLLNLPNAGQLTCADFVASGLTPQFAVDVTGLVKARLYRLSGSGSQTWAIGVSTATTRPNNVALVGWKGNAAAIDASGGLRVDATNGVVTVRGEVTDAADGVYTRVPVAYLYNDAASVLGVAGEAAGRITPYRAQHVNLRDALGNEIGTVASPLVASGVVSTKTDLTPSSPTTTSVGVASAQAVAAAATRKGLILRNLSTARISLGFGAAAVLDSGVTLYPQDSWRMDEYDFDLGAVNAIASAAASNMSVQEYLT